MKQKKGSTTLRSLHYFWQVTKKRGGIFALGVIATFGYVALLTYANSYFMGRIVDRVGEVAAAGGVAALAGSTGISAVFSVFGKYIAALILVNAVGQLCSKLQDYSIWKLEISASYDLATYCFDTLSNQSMTFHTNRYSGALVSQTTKFTNAFCTLVETGMYAILPLVFSVIMIIVMLVGVVPLYVLILCGILAVYIGVAYVMYRRILPLNSAAADAQNDLSGELSDSVTNILTVKTYGREDYERGLFNRANANVLRTDSRRMRSSMTRSALTSTLIVIIMIIVTVFISGGNTWFGISAGTLVMMFSYTYMLTMRFNEINSVMQRLNRVFGDAAGMTEILDEPRLVQDVPGARPLSVTEGAIDFEHLNFWYTDSLPAPGDNDPDGNTEPSAVKAGDLSGREKGTSASGGKNAQKQRGADHVFDDFSLHIPAGQRVGLVGKSGAGKTTLTKLLLRLSDIQEGRILVDGQDISRCTQQSLRRQIAYVPQEALLFHRSVRENIAYGRPEASEEEIRRAAAEANALEFIEKLPNGFDTVVGERGIKLSGGQRQRVAIARAILADAPILLLDEATSALDSESEKYVQEALINLMRGRTAIVVAHRLSTVAALDRIVVLSGGKVSEDGTHAELTTAGGEYARLWDRQTGAFLDV